MSASAAALPGNGLRGLWLSYRVHTYSELRPQSFTLKADGGTIIFFDCRAGCVHYAYWGLQVRGDWGLYNLRCEDWNLIPVRLRDTVLPFRRHHWRLVMDNKCRLPKETQWCWVIPSCIIYTTIEICFCPVTCLICVEEFFFVSKSIPFHRKQRLVTYIHSIRYDFRWLANPSHHITQHLTIS